MILGIIVVCSFVLFFVVACSSTPMSPIKIKTPIKKKNNNSIVNFNVESTKTSPETFYQSISSMYQNSKLIVNSVLFML